MPTLVSIEGGLPTLVAIEARLRVARCYLHEGISEGAVTPLPLATWVDSCSLQERVRSRNAAMQSAIAKARQVAASPLAVLIQGDTGTGKELFARHIHAMSGRAGPFVPINCSAVPEAMFEVELFGAMRGAYTGLDARRQGLFAVAHGGTLFLDEVGELPTTVQAKLLRVLEDGIVRPLGATVGHHVDVRVIAATNRHLESLVEHGAFRSDLYFRLAAATLIVPPLCERPEDQPALLSDAIDEACAFLGVAPKRLSDDAAAVLQRYAWPGNVRELKNVVTTAVLHTSGECIDVADLPPHVCRTSGPSSPPSRPAAFFEALTRFERAYLSDLLVRAGGNLSEAARLSGLSRTSVRAKARQHGLLPSAAGPHARMRLRKT